jgi:MFS family permease
MRESQTTAAGWLGLNGYQWLVLFAAWLGWGFDAFDGLLFNYVSPLCLPDLLDLTPGTPETRAAVIFWNGILTSLLLLGWAAGGVLFGRFTDRLGRTRTLLLTMLTYALATAACGLATNIYMLALFRLLAAFGIGGEWAAGASLVAETVPENRRLFAGAMLYTSAPLGVLAAGQVATFFTKTWAPLAAHPELAWRVVFFTGLVPAVFAILIRIRVKEPERWAAVADQARTRVRDLFAPALRRQTLGGLAVATTALIVWWSTNAFITIVFRSLAGADKALQSALPQTANNWFCLGGLLGTLLTIPVAHHLGRRAMFVLYFAISAAAIGATFGLALDPLTRAHLMAVVGLSTFGTLGSFTFYFPELFPLKVRGTGSGFCYNVGRVITAGFPFGIGYVALNPQIDPLSILRWVAVVPLVGIALVLAGVVEETRGRAIG